MKLETIVEELKGWATAETMPAEAGMARDALRAHAREQAIAETRALPYISEATAAEIFQRLVACD